MAQKTKGQLDNRMSLKSRKYEEIYFCGLLEVLALIAKSFVKLEIKAFK